MKPFPSLDTKISDDKFASLLSSHVPGTYSFMGSFNGRGVFLVLLLERWQHRHEEPFDFDGAIVHLNHLLSAVAGWQEWGLDEKGMGEYQRDIEEVLKGLRKEQTWEVRTRGGRERDRKRPVRHEANMTIIIEDLLKRWKWCDSSPESRRKRSWKQF
jgi:hypothetical protein